jgi:hypothetical protein
MLRLWLELLQCFLLLQSVQPSRLLLPVAPPSLVGATCGVTAAEPDPKPTLVAQSRCLPRTAKKEEPWRASKPAKTKAF